MTSKNKNRFKLLAITALFALPILLATVLSMFNWRPPGSKVYGQLQNPPTQYSSRSLPLSSGEQLFVPKQARWTLLLHLDPECETQCRAQLRGVSNAHDMLGRHAPALRVALDRDVDAFAVEQAASKKFSLASPDVAIIKQLLPTNPDTISALLFDPQGFLVMRYPAGFDAAGLRRDLGRLVHHNPNKK